MCSIAGLGAHRFVYLPNGIKHCRSGDVIPPDWRNFGTARSTADERPVLKLRAENVLHGSLSFHQGFY
jgi:hypothetical protein